MRMSHLVLGGLVIGFAVAASAAPLPQKSPAICVKPDKAKCLTLGYLDSKCGVEHRKTCEPFVIDGLKANPARKTALDAKVFKPAGTDIPAELAQGKLYPYKGPKSGRKLSTNATHVLSRSGFSFVPVRGVTAEQAAKHHRNPAYETNGKVASCAEFAYEKFYDWSRFIDGVAGCKGDDGCEVDVAFLTGKPGISRRKLRDKMGKELSPQIYYVKHKQFTKNDFFAFGKRMAYAGGPKGVAPSADIDALAAALDTGKLYYGFGCKGGNCFKDEWEFHEKKRESTKLVSEAEFKEYERRRDGLRELMSLHAAAVKKELSLPGGTPTEVAPELPFDLVTSDPFERYEIMKGFDTAARAGASKMIKKLGPAAIGKLPGAGVDTVPVLGAPQQGATAPRFRGGQRAAAGVLASMPPKPGSGTDQPGVSKPKSDMLAVTQCTKKAFDTAKVEIKEVLGVGPISCRIGHMLRGEWNRKLRGQKSCLDLDNDDCDWSPAIFRARFAVNESYAKQQQRAQDECMLWTNDQLSSKTNIDQVDAYIMDMRKAVSAELAKLGPYRMPGGVKGQKFGDKLADGEVEGDKDWFAGGYDYALEWSVEPIQKTQQGAVCDLRGVFSADADVDAWLINNHIAVVDAFARADVNVPNPDDNNKLGTHVRSHLNILGGQVFAADKYFTQVFEKSIARPLLTLPSPKPQWTVWIGPVPVTGAAWGEMRFGADLELAGVLKSPTCSIDNIKFGAEGSFEPWVAIDGRAQVGVGITGLISAGVRAALNLVTIGLPIHSSLLTSIKNISNEPQASLKFHADIALTLATLSGYVSLYLEFLMFTEEFELFAWNGIGPATIPLMPPLEAELPLVGMK